MYIEKNNYFKIIGIAFLLGILILNFVVFLNIFSTGLNLSKQNQEKLIFANIISILFGFFFINIRKIHANIILLVGSIIFSMILLETTLSFYPTILGNDFTNVVLSKYYVGYGGIYIYDRELKMNFMKPNFKAEMYFNHYRWLHETDKWGFRNPVDKDNAEIVVLGDSFIYGHGVEQSQTVGYFLEKITNLSVMNLARQGDCAFQQIYLLDQVGLKFKPKYVVYFFSNGDIRDLTVYLSEKDMKEFIETPIQNITFKERKDQKRNAFYEYLYYLSEKRPYIFKVYKLAIFTIKEKLFKGENEAKQIGLEDVRSLEWKYTKKAIQQMKYVSDLNKTEFIIVPISSGNRQQFEILKNIASEYNISFINTQSMNFVDSFYLSNDGHFSEKGARAMAELIAPKMK